MACCTSRGKPKELSKPKGPVWETADLTWWDFQRRRWRTLWLMRTIFYRLKKTAADTENLSPEEAEPLWTEVHSQSALEMKQHAESSKGLFIKAGQAMSSMPGTLPDEYVTQFKSLTNDLPVSRIEEVFSVIRADLKKPPRDIFSSFDQEPIASASIAQVHKARLRGTGEEVAVKVQHAGVDQVFLEDVNTLGIVAAQVQRWYPDLDFRKFAEEWQDSLPHELDFNLERRALERATAVLKGAGNACKLPKVHARLHGKHFFVMEFVETMDITNLGDPAFCERYGLDKHKVLETLLDAFGIMAFKDGLFHADPHVGNVRLILDKKAPGGAAPVLFDWGLYRELSDHERMGLAKVFHSLANFDINGLFDVLAQLGFKTKAELMTDEFKRDLLDKARAIMKDTVNKKQTRSNMQAEMKEWKDRVKKAEAEGPDSAKASVNPAYFLEDWPNCVIFFLRMMQILRGLCIQVDAEGMPILQIFAKNAKEALKDGSKTESLVKRVRMFAGREAMTVRREAAPPLQAPEEERPVRQETSATTDTAMVARMKAKLAALTAAQRIVGAQVAVYKGGQLVCDVTGGTLSTIDDRPVESGTHFPLMGALGAVSALALLRALRRRARRLSQAAAPADEGSPSAAAAADATALHTPIVRIWPEFSGGESELTLADVLGHCAGLQDAFPTNFGPSTLDDVAAVAQHLENADLSAAREPRYAYLMQNFVMAKLGDCLADEDNLLHWLGRELGDFGLDIAAPAGRGGEASICRDLPQLSRVSMQEVSEGRERRTTRTGSRPSSGLETQSLLQALAKNPLAFDPLQGNTEHGAKFRGGMSLGASACGLAELFSRPEVHEDLGALRALELAGEDPTAIGWLLAGGACERTIGGLQVLQLQGCGPRALLAQRQVGFGAVCGFGPCVGHFPDLGSSGGVTVAVMVNDVLHGRQAAAELFAEALAGYGYAPAWPSVPARVLADAARLARSNEAAPLLRSFGGVEALTGRLALGTGGGPRERCLAALGACAVRLGRQRGGSEEAVQSGRGSGRLRALGETCAATCGSLIGPRFRGSAAPASAARGSS